MAMHSAVLLPLALVALHTTSTNARFAHTYGSHMVLQKAPQRAVVWGYYTSGTVDQVTLILDAVPVPVFEGQEQGTWMAKLPATPASNTPHTLVLSENNTTTTLNDVLFGDVWVCSGQSNMAFLLQNAFNGSALVKESINYPNLRVFTSFKNNSPRPLAEQPHVEERWSRSSPAAVSQAAHRLHQVQQPLDDDWLVFSAVCYLYGVEMMKHTSYPIGLVNTNWGGTPVEFWSSKESLEQCNDDQNTSGGAKNLPKGIVGGAYNGMLKPLLNMSIYGAIWYQGESNANDVVTTVDPQGLPMVTYGCTFPSMIADWRKKWHEGSLGETSDMFYFGYVQLASWVASGTGPSQIRWAQSGGYGHVPNVQMPNVFNAVAIDLTDRTSPYGSVHIRDKVTVAKRLSAGGLAMAYGNKNVYWQGPIVKSARVLNHTIVVTFGNVGGNGLEIRNATGWEMCVLDATNPGLNCSLTDAANTTGVHGTWFAAHVLGSSNSTVTVKGEAEWGEILMNDQQRTMVRYGWKSLAWEYKQGGCTRWISRRLLLWS